MAKIPDATALGERPIPQARSTRIVDQSSAILGQATDRLAGTVSNIGERIVQQRAQYDVANARTGLLSADINTRSELDKDDNWQTYEQRYTEAMTKALSAVSANIKNGAARAAFEQDAKLDITRGMGQIREMARAKEVDTGRADLTALGDTNRALFLQAADEPTRAAILKNQQAALSGATEKGYISESERVAHSRAWAENAAEGWVSMQSPSKQLDVLANPKGTVADYIPADKRVEIADAAQRKRVADENMRYQLNERAQKASSDAASKDGDRLLAQGQMTSGWIEKNRNRLDPSDYRYFYKAMSGAGDAPRNPMIYADLRDRSGRGEDVRDEARNALKLGQIGTSDYDRVVGEVEQERPGWYKRGVDFISTSAAVSQLNPYPAAAQRKAAMLDDWQTWGKQNPKATDEEAQQSYRRLVSEYALINYNQLTLVKRQPQFLVGNRTTPDLHATAEATVNAFRDGRINRAEFDKQAALIKEWEDAYHPIQKPKPAK